MKRNLPLTVFLLCLALFCAACGVRMPSEETAGPDVPEAPGTAVLVTGDDSAGNGPVEPPAVDTGGDLPVEPPAVDAGADLPTDIPPVEEDDPSEERTSSGEDTEPPAEEDLSGLYTDKMGTEDIYSELILTWQGDGLYGVDIGLFRLCHLEGIAQVQEDGTLNFMNFVGGPPAVKAVITIDGEQAQVEITASEHEYLSPGDVFSFPDGKEQGE